MTSQFLPEGARTPSIQPATYLAQNHTKKTIQHTCDRVGSEMHQFLARTSRLRTPGRHSDNTLHRGGGAAKGQTLAHSLPTSQNYFPLHSHGARSCANPIRKPTRLEPYIRFPTTAPSHHAICRAKSDRGPYRAAAESQCGGLRLQKRGARPHMMTQFFESSSFLSSSATSAAFSCTGCDCRTTEPSARRR